MRDSIETSRQSHSKSLVSIFLAWKTVLFLLAAISPGPGYDTSALIALSDSGRENQARPLALIDQVTLNFFRWDALYFVKAAQRGYVYEQEWAFSWAYSLLLRSTKRRLFGDDEQSLKHYIWIGVVVSNVCHLFSVLVLYRLGQLIVGRQQSAKVSFIASVLHILSPAGMFLSVPYTESLFSALNITGMLHYVLAWGTARETGAWTVYQDAYMLSSGILFALATLVRGNGLLSGLIFLYDVACTVPHILAFQLDVSTARRLFVTCVAGSLLAIGFISPQFLAYQEYCKPSFAGADTRPWCDSWLPSIYSWVQSHYWNLGFLRYWTLPNLPLFMMAAPMLWLLVGSSITVIRKTLQQPTSRSHVHQNAGPADPANTEFGGYRFPQLALPQLVLAVTAITSFHVQIINRISSGYPVWYLVVAKWIADREIKQSKGKSETSTQWIIRWMVIYSLIQGILYAGFLPPA